MSSTAAAAPLPDIDLDHGRIRLGGLVFVYLERTLAPPDPLPYGLTLRAYGLAPTARVEAKNTVIAAVGEREAIWLGFQALNTSRPVVIRVRVEGPNPLDAITGKPWQNETTQLPRNHLLCPPDYCLPGLRLPNGTYRPFGTKALIRGSTTLEEINIFAGRPRPVCTAIKLVGPGDFSRITGQSPEPLDPDAAYKGWRLP